MHSLVKRSGPEAFPLAQRDTARNTSVVENARSSNASGGPVSDRGKHIIYAKLTNRNAIKLG